MAFQSKAPGLSWAAASCNRSVMPKQRESRTSSPWALDSVAPIAEIPFGHVRPVNPVVHIANFYKRAPRPIAASLFGDKRPPMGIPSTMARYSASRPHTSTSALKPTRHDSPRRRTPHAANTHMAIWHSRRPSFHSPI